MSQPQKYALLSVTNKQGLAQLGQGLISLGYKILSTSGSARVLKEAGCDYTEVSEYTSSPEILEGRVKSLHPKIYGGILYRRHLPQDLSELESIQAGSIDIVCVNFYDFAARKNTTRSFEELSEAIDIGGPCLLRAAAKNHPHVLPLSDPQDYPWVLEALSQGDLSLEQRKQLAYKAFTLTHLYDEMIAASLKPSSPSQDAPNPPELKEFVEKLSTQELRYGENAHQKAFLAAWNQPSFLGDIQQLGGKELSYNNYLDMDGAARVVLEFPSSPSITIVKHTNPCGFALCCSKHLKAQETSELWFKALHGDHLSSYGGIAATSLVVEAHLAKNICDHFLEVIMAPDFTSEALEILHSKKQLRIIKAPWLTGTKLPLPTQELRSILGGVLIQDTDTTSPSTQSLAEAPDLPQDWQVMSGDPPTSQRLLDLIVALKLVKHTKSNSITVVEGGTLYGVGCGMSSRIDAAKLALQKASNHSLTQATLASDAFFPFDDVVKLAAQHPIQAIVVPQGSIRDELSVKAAQHHNITLVFCHNRHFRH